MKISSAAVLLLIPFAGCVTTRGVSYEDDYVRVESSPPALFVHLDTKVRIKVKGTLLSFSGVDYAMPFSYLKIPGQDAILVLTRTAYDYDLLFHVVNLKTSEFIDIPGGKSYFGEYNGYADGFSDRSKWGAANSIQNVDSDTLTLVSVGKTIAEGSYREITILDLKNKKVRSRQLIHLDHTGEEVPGR